MYTVIVLLSPEYYARMSTQKFCCKLKSPTAAIVTYSFSRVAHMGVVLGRCTSLTHVVAMELQSRPATHHNRERT